MIRYRKYYVRAPKNDSNVTKCKTINLYKYAQTLFDASVLKLRKLDSSHKLQITLSRFSPHANNMAVMDMYIQFKLFALFNYGIYMIIKF